MNTEIHDSEIEAIADLLANADAGLAPPWSSELVDVIQESFSGLNPEIGLQVVKTFFALPIETRMQPHFDHVSFVRELLRGN